jgi:hypothetical protein
MNQSVRPIPVCRVAADMGPTLAARLDRYYPFLIFGLGFLIRIWLILAYPPIYGGDTVIHLRNYGHILLGHQLPALQVLIFITYKLTSIPFVFRCVMALIGAAACLGFYLMTKALSYETTALFAALFFVTNPFMNEISIVPFQEILMLGALCFAAYFYMEKRIAAASILLALACWTRYEAWMACPFFALQFILQKRISVRTTIAAAAIFCWAPLVWVAWHLGLASPGSYVIEIPQSVDRFVRWIYLGWIIAKNTPLPVMLFSVAGLYFLWTKRRFYQRGMWMAVAFTVLFGIAVLCSAHGDDHEGAASAERFVSSREAALPMGALLLLAGVGAGFSVRRRRWVAPINWLIDAAAIWGAVQSSLFVKAQVSPPAVQLSYALAQFADSQVRSDERMLISAKPFSDADLRLYLEKTKQTDGETGYRRAIENLKKDDLSPIDFQRTAVQSRKAGMLSSKGTPSDFDWIAVWSNSEPSASLTSQLRDRHPVDVLRSGALSIAIYRRGTRK